MLNRFSEYNNNDKWNILLKNLQKQFLCGYSLNCIAWKILTENINWEQQRQVIDVTYKSTLNKQMPIKLSYQLNFLKRFIQHLEENCNEIHDVVYESYCGLQQQLPKNRAEYAEYAFKHYLLDEMNYISLMESTAIVSDGTTGLCSWQASIALADYLIQNRDQVNKKNVLEIGSGIGLCGFFIQKLCQPKHLLLTDGSWSCIEMLKKNMNLNFPNSKLHCKNGKSTAIDVDGNIMECCVMNWCDVHVTEEVKCLKPQLLLAADVVYDDTILADLCQVINYVFHLVDNNMKMFLAATVRNANTLNKFLKLLRELKFSINEVNVFNSRNSRLLWDRSIPVKLMEIIRK